MARGFQGLALKAFGANDFTLTVTGARDVTESFRRLHFHAPGLLDQHPPHPTQWIRLWIPNGDKVQQRGYTVLNTDPAAHTFDIDFALHPGPAWTWASTAAAGDAIEASVLGSKFALPDQPPAEYLLFGDAASVPAINTLLTSISDAPVRVWLEWGHLADQEIPLDAGPETEVTWLPRDGTGDSIRAAATDLTTSGDAYAWVACNFGTTRSIVKSLKTIHRLPKTSITATAYWK